MNTSLISNDSIKRTKQKQSVSLTRSNRFRNNSDHRHFEDIFRVIDACEWTESVVVVNKLIAEYATGTIKHCANKKCMNDIVVLVEDEQTYEFDHNNAHKLGYKWCYEYNLFFCSECMDQAESCGSSHCDILSFIPECGKCDMCNAIAYKCRCHGYEWQCSNCDFNTCNNCFGTDPCVQCRRRFCRNCSVTKPVGFDNYCVCNTCYDDTIHKCNECNVECKLLFKSNQVLYSTDSTLEMEKCSHIECDDFICCNCAENETNGRRVFNTDRYDFQNFCDKHIPS